MDPKTQKTLIGGGVVLLAVYLLTSSAGGLLSGGSQGGGFGGGGGGGGGVLADPQPVQYDTPQTTFTPAPDKKSTTTSTTTSITPKTIGNLTYPAGGPGFYYDTTQTNTAPRSINNPTMAIQTPTGTINHNPPSGGPVIIGGAVNGTKDVKKGLDAFQGSALSFLRR